MRVSQNLESWSLVQVYRRETDGITLEHSVQSVPISVKDKMCYLASIFISFKHQDLVRTLVCKLIR